MKKNMVKKSVYSIVFILISGLFFGPVTNAGNNGDNNPPNPPVITGPQTGNIDEIIVYKFYISDPDVDDQLFQLEINFGDELIIERCDTGECKPWRNGETVEIEYIWRETGIYNITARVMDVYGEWSDWSDPLVVSMPKIKSYNIIPKILIWLLESFPFLQPYFHIIF